ncbi:hypothetical protein FHS68_001629 [Dyadobacter arcticus]|uniref:Uncharacterized protein n=1 Tax=Dyadobacter arcticus TaxID=1078754 RepID=A0ABX0UHG2_9BACT|nr:hypothetical protein [Dyadobacter arcticus]
MGRKDKMHCPQKDKFAQYHDYTKAKPTLDVIKLLNIKPIYYQCFTWKIFDQKCINSTGECTKTTGKNLHERLNFAEPYSQIHL